MPLRTRAICGIGICGKTICGDISSVGLPSISSSDIQAVARVVSDDGWFEYLFPITSLEMTVNQVYNNDAVTVSLINAGEILPGYSITIFLGQGAKQKTYTGIIQTENRETFISNGKILSELTCVHDMDELSHRYFDDITYSGALTDVIDDFIEDVGLNIVNECTNTIDKVDLQFESHSVTALEIIKRIISDKCYMYLEDEKLVIKDVSDEIVYTVNKNSDIVDFNRDFSEVNQYRKCTVRGGEVGGERIEQTYEDVNINSKKELFVEDDSILTDWDALNRAKTELNTKNEATEELTIKLAGLVSPDFGNVHVNLPSVNTIVELKTIRYSVDSSGLFTTLYLGKSYETFRNIFEKIKGS